MRSPILPLCAALALGTLACTDQPTEPTATPERAATVLDAAHGGAPHFFFLPPMVPRPQYSGVFDSTQSPVVTICALTDNGCGATVATFSGSQIEVQQADQAYRVYWKTQGAGLNPDKTYRIQVIVGGVILGYADARVGNGGSTIRIIDQGKAIKTITTGQLAIRFRIEEKPPVTGPWTNGEYVTYTQAEWGDAQSAAGTLLTASWNAIFGTTPMQVAPLSPSGHALLFTSANAVHAFLPQFGPAGNIQGRFTDPLTSLGGVLAGETTALFLNYIFSNAGHTPAPGGIRFGDLVMCGFAVPSGMNGIVVADFVRTALTTLVNGWAPYQTAAEIAQIASDLNASFANGTPSQFAQDHLIMGPCPGAWNRGDMTSYGPDNWGTTSDVAFNVLANFDLLYPGGMEVGLSGSAGYSILFTSANAILNYLPDCGFPASLTSDLVDPSSTRSGCLGSEVVALQLNVDFADAGRLPAASGIRFGDLHICGVMNDPAAVEGESVRALLARATQMLSGVVPDYGGPYDAGHLALFIAEVNKGFVYGEASFFARRHLVNGPCP